MLGKKKLSTIMGGFIKAKTELEGFIDQQEKIEGSLLEVARKIDLERAVAKTESLQALNSLSKIREILGE